MKRNVLSMWVVLLTIAATVLSACQTAAPAAQATEAPAAPKVKFALITPNPRGDRSFIDASVRGVERANTELSLNGQIIETNSIAEQDTATSGQ